jgi:8-amino-7-oxononanoate synthase
MNWLEHRIHDQLDQRLNQDIKRKLPEKKTGVDFFSNDYLGLANSEILKKTIIKQLTNLSLGSTGSRLVSGNSKLATDLEDELACRFNAPDALLFNSGFNLNLGLLSTLAQEGDVILLDQNIHASLKLGAKLSGASRNYFRHNDLSHLKQRLQYSRQKIREKKSLFIVVESVYSMDGDLCPLEKIVELCRRFQAHLILDEAHGAGILGPMGKGLACKHGLEDQIFARIITFGKAFGSHGAVLLIDRIYKDYLINFCSPFIYTTALPPHCLLSIRESVRLSQKNNDTREMLFRNINFFKEKLGSPKQKSAIFSIPTSHFQLAHKAKYLQTKGFLVSPIYAPTVKRGTERLRICIHSFNKIKDLNTLAQLLEETL